MRVGLALVVFAAALVPWHLPASRAGAEEGLGLRVFEVGALLSGGRTFLREGPPQLVAWSGGDDSPFGAEGEEALLPLGTIDELIELVKNDLAESPEWREGSGTDLRADGSQLFLTSRAGLAQAVAERLAAYERRVLGTLTLEVRTVRVAPGAEDLDGERLLAKALPGPYAVLTAFPSQKAAAFQGSQRAFLAGYEGGGAGPNALDPVVTVGNVGLMVDVEAAPAASPGTFLAEVGAYLVTAPAAFRRIPLAGGREIEAPAWDVTRVRSTVLLEAGRWTRLDAAAADAGEDGARWTFLLRVHENPYEPRLGPISLPSFLVVPPAIEPGGSPWRGETTRRVVDASMLRMGHRCFYNGGTPPHLYLSGFKDEGASEISCAMEIFSVESLAEMLKATFAERVAWDGEAASIEVRHDRIHFRGPAALADAVAERAGEFIRDVLWEFSTKAAIVEVPDEMALGLLAKPGRRNGAPLLGAEGAAAIEEAVRAGAATRVDAVALTALGANGTDTDPARRVTYLADYDLAGTGPEASARPVLAEAPAGFLLDVRGGLTGGRDAVHLEVRAMRTSLPATFRTLPTPHGLIELPTMEVLRVRTSLVVPFGETAIVGAGGSGGRTRLLLLTPTTQRPGG